MALQALISTADNINKQKKPTTFRVDLFCTIVLIHVPPYKFSEQFAVVGLLFMVHCQLFTYYRFH